MRIRIPLIRRKQGGNWGSLSDGLTGWCYSSSYGTPTKTAMWFDEYVSQHKSEGAKDIFTTCFGRKKGVLSIGDINSSLYEGEVYWADIQDSTFYALHLNDLRMDNVSLISVRTSAPP